jgi:hypothetical protein
VHDLGRTDSVIYMVGSGWMTDECTTTLTEKRWLRSPYDPKLKVALRMLPKREGDSPIVFEGRTQNGGRSVFLGR